VQISWFQDVGMKEIVLSLHSPSILPSLSDCKHFLDYLTLTDTVSTVDKRPCSCGSNSERYSTQSAWAFLLKLIKFSTWCMFISNFLSCHYSNMRISNMVLTAEYLITVYEVIHMSHKIKCNAILLLYQGMLLIGSWKWEIENCDAAYLLRNVSSLIVNFCLLYSAFIERYHVMYTEHFFFAFWIPITQGLS
jgi:hypothetical protein